MDNHVHPQRALSFRVYGVLAFASMCGHLNALKCPLWWFGALLHDMTLRSQDPSVGGLAAPGFIDEGTEAQRGSGNFLNYSLLSGNTVSLCLGLCAFCRCFRGPEVGGRISERPTLLLSAGEGVGGKAANIPQS